MQGRKLSNYSPRTRKTEHEYTSSLDLKDEKSLLISDLVNTG